MDLWILNEDLQRRGIIDTASSIIWANRFRQCGDFEIYVPMSTEVAELLKVDNFVMREDDEMVGIIERVEITTNEESGDFLLVSGRCARSILGRRIVWEQTVYDTSVEIVLRSLIQDAFISPALSARKCDKLTLAPGRGYIDQVKVQYTGDNLLEAVEKLCTAYNYGFKMTRDTGRLMVDFYKSENRTAGQSVNPRVIFSETYDNLVATDYVLDKTAYKSVALVAGEGEGSNRRRTVVERGVDTTGLHRREVFVDARDISSNEGEITDDVYMAQLTARGTTALGEAPCVQSFEGTVEPRQMYTYKVDYFLGDMVTVINKYGIQADAQVLEVVETWDENGYTCTPTFG